MKPQAKQVIDDVSERYRIPQELILGRLRAYRLLEARMEISNLLRLRGYSNRQIGDVLGRERTTIAFYLGGGKRKPARPRWRRPRVKTIWMAAPEKPPKPQTRKRYLIPYAGYDKSDYKWQRRAA